MGRKIASTLKIIPLVQPHSISPLVKSTTHTHTHTHTAKQWKEVCRSTILHKTDIYTYIYIQRKILLCRSS